MLDDRNDVWTEGLQFSSAEVCSEAHAEDSDESRRGELEA